MENLPNMTPKGMETYSGSAGLGVTAPIQQSITTNSIVDKIFDKESILEDFKQMLRGYSYEVMKETNRTGTEYYIKKWVKKFEPKLNESGIAKILLELKSITANEIKASKMKIELIHQKYIAYKLQLNDSLYLSHADFNISPEDYVDLINSISNFYHFILMSIEDGRLIKLLVTNISEHHEYVGAPIQQKQGIWDKASSFLRRN